MSDEREIERHLGIVERIEKANNRDELPNISFATIASYLASNVYFNNVKISQTLFKPVTDALLDYGFFGHENVRQAFIKVILENYPEVSEDEIIAKYNEILNAKRIGYILSEITLRNEKQYQIEKKENLENHNRIIKEINATFDLKDLPKVGLSELNRRIVRAINDNDFNNNFKISELKILTDAYLEQKPFSEIETIILELCERQKLSDEDKKLMSEQIIGALLVDETIEYIVEEIKLKEERKTFIYKNDHEITMDAIKDATRISQLPPCLSFSTLTGYFYGNSILYPNGERIKAEMFRNLATLLLNGAKWEDEEVVSEVRMIAERNHPEKEDAFEILYQKLSQLPKTYYLVEEINYSQERQNEFIGKSCSNVNVYFIPNDKSPIEGGRFYNCYINRVGNLDLSQILPLNLEEIVPPSLDIDSVEWYVQQRYDSTFKTAGGIILNKDETIGNVNVFKPNDGKVGVSPEEKEKMDQISDLDKKIEDKKKELQSVEETLEKKRKEVSNIVVDILQSYEKKALELQMEFLGQIQALKEEFTPSNPENENTEGGKGKK